MSLTKKQKALLGKAADILDQITTKCGGPGGKPGPCPSGVSASGGSSASPTPAKYPSRRPDYKFADTTIPGLKAAAKDAGIKPKGGKIQLVRDLADAYHKDTSQFKSAKTAETAYTCYYAERRRFWKDDGTPV